MDTEVFKEWDWELAAEGANYHVSMEEEPWKTARHQVCKELEITRLAMAGLLPDY
jgi:hypothetical protein